MRPQLRVCQSSLGRCESRFDTRAPTPPRAPTTPTVSLFIDRFITCGYHLSLVRGVACQANYHGNGKWYPATIHWIRDNGDFDVVYEDGDKEKKMQPSWVRQCAGTAASRQNRDIAATKIQARYRIVNAKGKTRMIRQDKAALKIQACGRSTAATPLHARGAEPKNSAPP